VYDCGLWWSCGGCLEYEKYYNPRIDILSWVIILNKEDREFQVELTKQSSNMQFCHTGFFAFFAAAIALYCTGMYTTSNLFVGWATLCIVVGLIIGAGFCYREYNKSKLALERLICKTESCHKCLCVCAIKQPIVSAEETT